MHPSALHQMGRVKLGRIVSYEDAGNIASLMTMRLAFPIFCRTLVYPILQDDVATALWEEGSKSKEKPPHSDKGGSSSDKRVIAFLTMTQTSLTWATSSSRSLDMPRNSTRKNIPFPVTDGCASHGSVHHTLGFGRDFQVEYGGRQEAAEKS